MTLTIDIQLNSIDCHYAECRDYLNVMLSVIMLSVVGLNVVMLSVVAPFLGTPEICQFYFANFIFS
jgi:hypothetical protein